MSKNKTFYDFSFSFLEGPSGYFILKEDEVSELRDTI